MLGGSPRRAAGCLLRTGRAVPDLLSVLEDFGAFPAVIEAELRRYLPFLATTKVLIAAMRHGTGRETAHQAISEHAIAVALHMRETGRSDNDLLDRLAADPRLGVTSRRAGRRLHNPLELAGTAAAGGDAGQPDREGATAHPDAGSYRPVRCCRTLSIARTYPLLAAAEFRRYSTIGWRSWPASPRSRCSGSSGSASCSRPFHPLAARSPVTTSSWPRPTSGSARRCWPHRPAGLIEIAERVSSGEIAVDFARPVDLQLAWWARDLGRAAFQLLSRGLPPLFIGAVTVGIALPDSWSAYPLGLMSLVLAVSISFTLRFLVNLIAFWTFDVRGYMGLYLIIGSLFCGLFIPVHLFPKWLQVVAYATPFPSMLQTPIDVLSGWALGWPPRRSLPASLPGWSLSSASPDWCSGGPHVGWWCKVAELSAAEAYRILIGSRIRSQLAYRTSFWLNVATSVAVGLVEFVEIYAIFANVPVFGGLDLRQSALVFALGNMGFALADTIFASWTRSPATCVWGGWRSFSSGQCHCCCSSSRPRFRCAGWAGSP